MARSGLQQGPVGAHQALSILNCTTLHLILTVSKVVKGQTDSLCFFGDNLLDGFVVVFTYYCPNQTSYVTAINVQGRLGLLKDRATLPFKFHPELSILQDGMRSRNIYHLYFSNRGEKYFPRFALSFHCESSALQRRSSSLISKLPMYSYKRKRSRVAKITFYT